MMTAFRGTAYVSADTMGPNASDDDAERFAMYLLDRMPDVAIIVGQGRTDAHIQDELNEAWEDWCGM